MVLKDALHQNEDIHQESERNEFWETGTPHSAGFSQKRREHIQDVKDGQLQRDNAIRSQKEYLITNTFRSGIKKYVWEFLSWLSG